MKKKITKRELQQALELYYEIQDIAGTKGQVQLVLKQLAEVKSILDRLNTVRKLNSILDQFEKQYWVLKEYLTLEEAAAYTDLSVSTIRHMSSKKVLPIYKPVGRIYIKREELMKWFYDHRYPSQDEIEENARRYNEEAKKIRAKRMLKKALKSRKKN